MTFGCRLKIVFVLCVMGFECKEVLVLVVLFLQKK